MKKRLGPSFSIAPLLQNFNLTLDDEIEEQIKRSVDKGIADDDPTDFTGKKP